MGETKRPICDYEGSDYQQRFWERGDRRYEDRVEAIALGRLLPAGEGILLEVGAGAGRNSARYQGFERIVLMDYSRTQLGQARNRLGPSRRYLYVAADVYSMPFAPAVFDAATMIRTLHHMVEPLSALRCVRQTLHTGADFVLEYANKRNLKAILRWLLRRQDWNPFDPEPVEFVELNFDFHPKSVETWLRTADFEIRRRLTVSHFRLDLLKRLIPLRVLVSLDAILQWTGALWQYTPSVFLHAKATGPDISNPTGAFWRCPKCAGVELLETSEGLRCQGCGRLWPLEAGIYDFKT
jgi:ubiquinone/menaquinone biosynthesis C-methylase UbiE